MTQSLVGNAQDYAYAWYFWFFLVALSEETCVSCRWGGSSARRGARLESSWRVGLEQCCQPPRSTLLRANCAHMPCCQGPNCAHMPCCQGPNCAHMPCCQGHNWMPKNPTSRQQQLHQPYSVRLYALLASHLVLPQHYMQRPSVSICKPAHREGERTRLGAVQLRHTVRGRHSHARV